MKMDPKKPPKATLEWYWVTPDWAATVLPEGEVYRRFRPGTTERYAEAVKRGEWEPEGGAAIVLGPDGKAKDGQHRLQISVRHGLSFWTILVRKSRAPAHKFDVGLVRTLADWLHYQGVPSARNLAAAIRVVWRGKNGYLRSLPSEKKPTLDQLIQIYEKNPAILKSVRRCRNASGLIGLGCLAGLHYLFGERDAEMADAYVTALLTGADLHTDDAMFKLRQRLIAEATGRWPQSTAKTKVRRSGPVERIALCIKAWNFRCENRICKKLQWRPWTDPFPEIMSPEN